MPATPHLEKHFTAGEVIRDIVIGMSDGLTVPFALAAGLSGATTSTAIVVTAGLAEVAAGSIAMGLGGYLAAKSDADHYAAERKREVEETKNKKSFEDEEVAQVFREYGLTEAEIAPVLNAFHKNPENWVDFMMRFELGLEKPDPRRAFTSALAIAIAYIVGGLIPLSPYFVFPSAQVALPVSVIMTLIALLIFGYFKGKFTGAAPVASAIKTMLVGGIAAGVAFAIAKLIG